MDADRLGRSWLAEHGQRRRCRRARCAACSSTASSGVGGVIVFLPQILILFAFIAVLEDCGYMARAAFLMDS